MGWERGVFNWHNGGAVVVFSCAMVRRESGSAPFWGIACGVIAPVLGPQRHAPQSAGDNFVGAGLPAMRPAQSLIEVQALLAVPQRACLRAVLVLGGRLLVEASGCPGIGAAGCPSAG
jgi:hypothetical protein